MTAGLLTPRPAARNWSTPVGDISTTWSLSVYRASGTGDAHEYTTHRLSTAARVCEEYALESARPWVSRITLTEHVREVTRRALEHGEIPAGAAVPAGAPPRDTQACARHYEVVGLHPVPLVLPDPDAVREFLAELPTDERFVFRVVEVTVRDFTRVINPDDLPSPRT